MLNLFETSTKYIERKCAAIEKRSAIEATKHRFACVAQAMKRIDQKGAAK